MYAKLNKIISNVNLDYIEEIKSETKKINTSVTFKFRGTNKKLNTTLLSYGNN